MSDAIAQFAHAKYLNLETFRKNGAGVRTPVWFVQEPQPTPTAGAERNDQTGSVVFYLYSAPDAGKVKRIRNNAKVRIAPCTFRGQLRGAWVDGRARICASDQAAHGQDGLRRKYGWIKIAGDFVSRLRGRPQTVIAIEV